MSYAAFKVGVYTLGCKVNQYESEAIAEALQKLNIQTASANEKCDAYVINTCTVTSESDRKAKQFIRRALKKDPDALVVVTGCFAQISPESVARITGVDYVVGNTKKMLVADLILNYINSGRKKPQEAKIFIEDIENAPFEPMTITHFDRTRAYVKIEDGCENRCTYCIIPKARGIVRSKQPSEVIAELRTLCGGGCKEIVLTGIETASYGKDLTSYSLADLLEDIGAIEGLGRVRLGSLDPSLMKQNFVDRIARLPYVAPQFHLSLQSGSDKILALMKRKYNRQMALDAIRRIRAAITGVQFTTDVIVGFPGETEEDFLDTVSFVKEARFLMLHVFTYSKRPCTLAANMKDQVDESIKKERSAILIELGNAVRSEILSEIASSNPTVEVLFESYEDGFAYGHTDNFVEVKAPSDEPLHSEIRQVVITSSVGDKYLLGKILN